MMICYGKTSVNCFFSSNNIFFLSISSLLAYTHSHCAFLHPPAYSNCTCISTHNSFCGRWNCQKFFLILFMSVIPQNSVPSFPKIYSKKLLWVQSPALNTLELQKLFPIWKFAVLCGHQHRGSGWVCGVRNCCFPKCMSVLISVTSIMVRVLKR